MLKDFYKLKEEFLRVWENFAPPPGIRPSFLPRAREIRQKNLPRCPGFARSKKIFPGVAWGVCTQLELTQTLLLKLQILALLEFSSSKSDGS